MERRAVTAHFELYGLRDGRWLLDACFADEAEARTALERARRQPDVRGVRLVREVNFAKAQDPLVTVLYDSTQADTPLVFKQPTPAARPQQAAARVPPPVRAPVHPRLHLDDELANAVSASNRASPWLAYAFGITGFVTALLSALWAFG
ncbi:MAG: hypothetical protein EA356_07030 [Geminicoccaceae bacterium]|nr:MAG: hypothetical protein EA356_07030 [Geminicoccaceae bacterium]